MKYIAKVIVVLLVSAIGIAMILPAVTAEMPIHTGLKYPQTVWSDLGEKGSAAGRANVYAGGVLYGAGGAYIAIVNANNVSQEYYNTTSDAYGNYQITGINATYSSALGQGPLGQPGNITDYYRGTAMYKMYANKSPYGEGYSAAFGIDADLSGTATTSIAIYPKPATIVLYAERSSVYVNGTDNIMVTAEMYDALGNPVADGYNINFTIGNSTSNAWNGGFPWTADNGSLNCAGNRDATDTYTHDNTGAAGVRFGWVPEDSGNNDATIWAYWYDSEYPGTSAGVFTNINIDFESPVHDAIYVPGDYSTIQEAINAANPDDTIYVDSGTYHEQLTVKKQLTLVGRDTGSGLPVVDGSGGSAMTILGNRILVQGFNVTNSTYGIRAITSDNIIFGNIASYNTYGISVENNYTVYIASGDPVSRDPVISTARYECANNLIFENTAIYNKYGIRSFFTRNTTYRCNNMSGNLYNFGDIIMDSLNVNDVDTSNLVDGRPVYYLVGARDRVIDGSSGAGTVYLVDCSNITVQDLTLQNNAFAVYLLHTNDSRIVNVTANNDECGIYLSDLCQNNTVSTNLVTNTMGSIFICFADNNTLTGNTVLNGQLGIMLLGTKYNVLRNNTMSGNTYNFGDMRIIDGSPCNDVDVSNLVDGRPVYYLVGVRDQVIDGSSGAGTVYLVDCSNITVQDLDLGRNYYGAQITSSNDIIIRNVTSDNSYMGIELYNTSHAIVKDNTANNGKYGINILYADDNSVTGNTVNNNEWAGIYLYSSVNNLVSGNAITNGNDSGILMYLSTDNRIFSNHIRNNSVNANIHEGGANAWNSEAPVQYMFNGNVYTNYTGNYWGDYAGDDLDGDGIGDSPYVVDANNVDGYPLLPYAPAQYLNASFVSDNIPDTMVSGGTYNISVTFMNTGSLPWSESDRIRLAVWGDNASFGLNGDCRSESGYAEYTIQADDTVMPGEDYTWYIDATPTAEGGKWLGIGMVNESASPQFFGPEAYAFPYVCQGTLDAGITVECPDVPTLYMPYEANVMVRNNGSAVWSEEGNIRLAVWGNDPAGAGMAGDMTGEAGYLEYALPAGVSVYPGEQYTWHINATPTTEGGYWLGFGMVKDSASPQFFGPEAFAFPYVWPGTLDAVTAATYPELPIAYQPIGSTVSVINNGSAVWTEASKIRLAVWGNDPAGAGLPGDLIGESGYREYLLPAGVMVYPGEQYTWYMNATPTTEGGYWLGFGMVKDSAIPQFFGPEAYAFPYVWLGMPDQAYVSDTIPDSMEAGQTYNCSIAFRNDGSTVWTEDNRIRLAVWGNNAAFGLDGNCTSEAGYAEYTISPGTYVMPGQEYTWYFDVKPTTEGSYWLGFSPMQDKASPWFFGTPIYKSPGITG